MSVLFKKSVSILLVAVMALTLAVTCFAGTSPFADDAYATVITASDFQNNGTTAYDRFASILGKAKADGMPTPDSLLVGGDYTLLLFDNAVPGISRIRSRVLAAYPDANPESMIFIQGNHDNKKDEFTETGFYDMGAYCLYAINEDSFPWQQKNKKADGVKALAADIEKSLDSMIASGDKRPVILVTHVPLHHTNRSGYGDNLYASYIFNVVNEKAKQLDIIFLFGHNHSGAYDDYIGGSVNYLKPGDKIRIPLTDKTGEDCYTEETLNFTYTNCGYVGTSKNTVSETSTNVFTMGVIQFTPDKIKFIRYSEDGLFYSKEITKVNPGSAANAPQYPDMECSCLCHSDNAFLQFVWKIYSFFLKLFNAEPYCACGKVHI